MCDQLIFLRFFIKLDDPLRHWRKGKSEAALKPQKEYCFNLNKNNILENTMLRQVFRCRSEHLNFINGFLFSREESHISKTHICSKNRLTRCVTDAKAGSEIVL
jgi:hypothetical protein